jgi:flagellin-like protein
MKLHHRLNLKGDRAVSPVIGVILMVAITVILAAVIGAFVLEIGDQQETAPNTSFDSSQKVRFLSMGYSNYGFGGCSDANANGINECWNLSTVEYAHAGGETIDYRRVRISVDGNESVWTPNKWGKCNDCWNKPMPQPDVRQYLGSNQNVEFKSGESWSATWYCGYVCKESEMDPDDFPEKYVHENGQVPAHEDIPWNDLPMGQNNENIIVYQNYGWMENWGFMPQAQDSTENPYRVGILDPLYGDETVQMVWEASSGGKTQTLARTTVEQGSPDKEFSEVG